MGQVRRRQFLIAAGALLAPPLASFAQQQTGKIARIGFLGTSSAANAGSRVEGLRTGLRDLGYVEGKNLVIEFRWAQEDYKQLPDFAVELVRLKVDVIVAQGVPGSRAASKVTKTVPIVMAAAGDAVATGLVASLARPGENITGLSIFSPELGSKRLELLKETMPRITQAAVLLNPDNLVTGPALQAVETTAKSLKVGLRQFAVRRPHEFQSAFAAMVKLRVGGIANLEDAMLNANPGAIAALAVKHRLPCVGNKEFAEAGGMIGYGVNWVDIFRRAAYFVDKILKGVKAGDLPVEQPTTFDLVINLETAKALGVTIPQSLLARADRVIQ